MAGDSGFYDRWLDLAFLFHPVYRVASSVIYDLLADYHRRRRGDPRRAYMRNDKGKRGGGLSSFQIKRLKRSSYFFYWMITYATYKISTSPVLLYKYYISLFVFPYLSSSLIKRFS